MSQKRSNDEEDDMMTLCTKEDGRPRRPRTLGFSGHIDERVRESIPAPTVTVVSPPKKSGGDAARLDLLFIKNEPLRLKEGDCFISERSNPRQQFAFARRHSPAGGQEAHRPDRRRGPFYKLTTSWRLFWQPFSRQVPWQRPSWPRVLPSLLARLSSQPSWRPEQGVQRGHRPQGTGE